MLFLRINCICLLPLGYLTILCYAPKCFVLAASFLCLRCVCFHQHDIKQTLKTILVCTDNSLWLWFIKVISELACSSQFIRNKCRNYSLYANRFNRSGGKKCSVWSNKFTYYNRVCRYPCHEPIGIQQATRIEADSGLMNTNPWFIDLFCFISTGFGLYL